MLIPGAVAGRRENIKTVEHTHTQFQHVNTEANRMPLAVIYRHIYLPACTAVCAYSQERHVVPASPPNGAVSEDCISPSFPLINKSMSRLSTQLGHREKRVTTSACLKRCSPDDATTQQLRISHLLRLLEAVAQQ